MLVHQAADQYEEEHGLFQEDKIEVSYTAEVEANLTHQTHHYQLGSEI